jgi:hypothetical protein
MEIHYGPRSVHAEVESWLQRLLTEDRSRRRIRRPHRSRAR